jgi:hypothetical protein
VIGILVGSREHDLLKGSLRRRRHDVEIEVVALLKLDPDGAATAERDLTDAGANA